MSLRRILFAGGILLAYAILVTRVPLLNYLGYEFSAAIALLLPLVPGLFFLRAFARRGEPETDANAGGVPHRPEGGGELRALAATGLIVPLAVGWMNAVFVKNCSPGEGVAWFLLLPGVGMIWVVALAWFCTAVFRRRVIWYLAIISVVMVHPLVLGYLTPRIDSYNFIYGYFPGFTYDEDLTITPTLLAWRGVTLLCALLFVSAGKVASARREGRKARLPSAVFIILLAAVVTAWIFRTDLGFETTASSLRRALGSAARTRHFRIYYDPAAVPADEIRWVAAEHEFRYDEVSRFLGSDTGRVIESYIYPDAPTKRRLIGAGNTDIAKPWRGEIHLDLDSWRFTLKHELVHALAAEFGMPVIGANINIGLVEGLAMAAGPPFGNRTAEEYAAAMVRFGIVDDPGALIRPAGFAFRSSTVSYVLMGAFCGHLISTRGMGPFREWYGGASPLEAYGVDADSLVALWRESLRKVEVPENWRAHVDYYFNRGSIFSRECARTVANLNARGSASLRSRDYPSARGYFSSALGESWNPGSFVAMVRSMMGSGDFGGVIKMFVTESGDSLKRGSLEGYRLLLGDALLARGEYPGALRTYREIRSLDLSPGMNEAVALRIAVTETDDLREYLVPWLTGSQEDSAALDLVRGLESGENPALLAYVRGRLMLRRNDYAGAARETANFFAPFADPVLNGAMNDLTAAAFFRLGDFLSARVFFERTLGYHPGAALAARTRDRAARCRWFERGWATMEMTLK